VTVVDKARRAFIFTGFFLFRQIFQSRIKNIYLIPYYLLRPGKDASTIYGVFERQKWPRRGLF
jgi:hypothetical protein